jgi:hypothetical protein
MRKLKLLPFLLLCSCASLGPKYTSPPLKDSKSATLTIYRPSLFTGSAVSPYLCIDQQVAGEIANGGYQTLQLSPGKHRIEQKINGVFSGTFVTDLKAGQAYYIRYDASTYNGTSDTITTNASVQGGLVGYAVASMFVPDKKDIEAITTNVDTRVQKTVHNPGMFFVKESFALSELPQTKEYKLNKFSKNFCEAKKLK